MVNVNWPTSVAGEADIVSSVSASACHRGGPIGVNPGELALVYGISCLMHAYNMYDYFPKELILSDTFTSRWFQNLNFLNRNITNIP